MKQNELFIENNQDENLLTNINEDPLIQEYKNCLSYIYHRSGHEQEEKDACQFARLVELLRNGVDPIISSENMTILDIYMRETRTSISDNILNLIFHNILSVNYLKEFFIKTLNKKDYSSESFMHEPSFYKKRSEVMISIFCNLQDKYDIKNILSEQEISELGRMFMSVEYRPGFESVSDVKDLLENAGDYIGKYFIIFEYHPKVESLLNKIGIDFKSDSVLDKYNFFSIQKKSDVEKSDVEKSDVEKSDVEKSDVEKSDVGKPDVGKPDVGLSATYNIINNFLKLSGQSLKSLEIFFDKSELCQEKEIVIIYRGHGSNNKDNYAIDDVIFQPVLKKIFESVKDYEKPVTLLIDSCYGNYCIKPELWSDYKDLKLPLKIYTLADVATPFRSLTKAHFRTFKQLFDTDKNQGNTEDFADIWVEHYRKAVLEDFNTQNDKKKSVARGYEPRKIDFKEWKIYKSDNLHIKGFQEALSLEEWQNNLPQLQQGQVNQKIVHQGLQNFQQQENTQVIGISDINATENIEFQG